MLTCTVDKFISIDCHFALDAPHEFTITAQAEGAALNLNVYDQITVYRDGTAILIGVITSKRVTSGKIVTYSGQDISSFWAYNTTVQKTANEYTLTNLAAVSAIIDPRISAPSSQACYGYGEFDGTIISYILRICNSFGLHYLPNPLTIGYTITADIVEPSVQKTLVPTCSWVIEDNAQDRISTVYLQKSVTVPEGEEVTISNGSQSYEISSPLQNSIPNGSQSAYPRNVYIDPGTWQQVVLFAHSTFTDFNVPVDINDAVKIVINSWSDTEANPRWQLYLYEDTTLLHHFYLTGEGAAWEATGNHKCNKAVIARVNPQTNEIEYPNFSGLSCTVTCYDTLPSGVQPWQQSFLSGDGGRPDTNVIDEPMYPPVAQLDGVRVAKYDSDPHASSIEAPGVLGIMVSLPAVTYTDAASGGIDLPLTQLTLRDSSANATSSMQGMY